MSADRWAGLRAAVAAASPGPWEVAGPGGAAAPPDLAFCAAAREAVPALLAERDELREALARLMAAADAFARCGLTRPVTVAECEELSAAVRQARGVIERTGR